MPVHLCTRPAPGRPEREDLGVHVFVSKYVARVTAHSVLPICTNMSALDSWKQHFAGHKDVPHVSRGCEHASLTAVTTLF